MCRISAIYLRLTVLFVVYDRFVAVDLTGGLRVKYGDGFVEEQQHLFSLPLTLCEAQCQGWSQTPRPPGPLPELVMYCYSDRNVCALYDDLGYISGLQYAFDQSIYSDHVLDWRTQGFTEWIPAVDSGPVRAYWTTQMYFVSQETLLKSKEERLSSRIANQTLQEGGVWVTSVYGQLLKIPDDEENIIVEQTFTEQGCSEQIGYTYFAAAGTPCNSYGFNMWAPAVSQGQLVSIGLITFGKYSITSGMDRNWYNTMTADEYRVLFPSVSECAYSYAETPGVVTAFTFFIQDMSEILCPHEVYYEAEIDPYAIQFTQSSQTNKNIRPTAYYGPYVSPTSVYKGSFYY